MSARLNIVRAAALALALGTFASAPAVAQGLFDFFHGGGQQQRGWFGQGRQYVPQQASPFADPGQYGSDRPANTPSYGTGRSVAYCVRLCDGRYFPIQRVAKANSVQLCSAFCPASKTQIFNGSQIDHAAASNGARYADLDNAFVYREKIVPDCTCNGKDTFGLAKIDVASDPTLRQGDIVTTGDNVKVALTAMAASKERREASNDRPALRGGASRRVATRPGAAAPEERPED